jgi:tRNA (guanosine-2'-O-)-methyltransferase
MSRKNYLSSEALLAEDVLTDRRVERIRTVAANRQRGVMVLMEDVYNPHNLAAIARSCDAFGVQQIAFTLEDHDQFDPQEVGRVSSSSASKWLDYRIFEDGTRACLTTLKREGWHIAATLVDEKARPLYEIDFTVPEYDKLVIMVGNERSGLSPTAAELADTTVFIPMAGMIRSFNVSVATAITLAEITRQRNASDKRYTLDDDAASALAADFMLR